MVSDKLVGEAPRGLSKNEATCDRRREGFLIDSSGLSKEADTRPVVFCLPHAGAGSSAYRGWSDSIGLTAEVVLLQLPGRESRFREPLLSQMREATGEYCQVIASYDRPYILFGNSLGGLIAFEIAHEMERRCGRGPIHLLVASASAPHVPRRLPPIHALSDREFVQNLNDRYQCLPQQILDDPEYLAALIPALRADLKIFETYQYRKREALSCPISVFGGRKDGSMHEEDLNSWGEHTSSDFQLKMFDAGHIFLQSHKPGLIGHLRSAIAKQTMRL